MIASSAIHEARKAGIQADLITPVGSLRRFAPDVRDVSLLAAASAAQHAHILRAFGRIPIASRVISKTAVSTTIATERGDVTLHVVEGTQTGPALVWHTGSRAHVDQLQRRALERGLHFDGGQLKHAIDGMISCPTEQEFYALLGLPYLAPELRHGDDEIPTAERGSLPELISDSHIRGDLHMHSTWSDGRNTIEEMVREAERLGYEYIAITDHSPRAFTARSVTEDDVPRQRAEIDALREHCRIQILHGIEVDILQDGTLDFDDATLRAFDIVLASLHDSGGQDGSVLTERYLRAIAHPLVNVITHPANRSPAYSPGYNLDFDRLFAAAAESGTAMEIDGAPGHLDMDGAIARRAAAAGVTIVINSDCHRADGLARQMRFGIGTARRGWVEARHVLNTGSIDSVRSFVARKRAVGSRRQTRP
jgi:DNA polymerase (family 10)